MKAADMDTRPSFPLMKQNDVVSFYHLQMPRWLFSHEKYKSLSLESKVAYTFLLNRFQLSRLNGWVNKDGEVFVIFTRENLAEEMQISYKKAIASFKELVAAGLIWEKRVGRGNANQIYLAVVELPQSDAKKHSTAPFGNGGARPAESAHQEQDAESTPGEVDSECATIQEVPKQQVLNSEIGTSRPAILAYPDLPKRHPSNTDKSYIDLSKKEVSQSVTAQETDATDDEDLSEILERSELWVLPEEVRDVFQSAIERLFYTDQLRIGGATLPQANVRSHLWKLDGMTVQDAYAKLRANTGQKVKNSSAYVMTTLFNCIHEGQSDLLVDPYLNSLHASVPPVCREVMAQCC